MSLKQKFQITEVPTYEGPEPWADFESVRNTHNEMPYVAGYDKFREMGKFDELPPGIDISKQMGYPESFARGFGGDSDVSGGVDGNALEKGFAKRRLSGSDDQYTGENIDLFYGDVDGFVYRNNYMDRE